MASGPWDNVQLQGPPNGPAWVQAAAQMMGATQGAINNAANQYQNWQNFNYQQNQRNFFQDHNNQAALQQAMEGMPQQYQQYAPLFQALMQSGGAPAAQQMLPVLIGQQQQGNFYNALNPPGGQQPQPTTPTAVYHITGSNGASSTPDSNSYNAGLAPNVRQMAIDSGVDPESPQFKRAFSKFDIDKDLINQSVISAVQQRIDALKNGSETPNRGGVNPVPQSGPGDQQAQRASGGNELPSRMGEGSPAMTPRQTGERRTAQAAAVPAQRTTPIGNVQDADQADALARYYNKLSTAPGINQQQAAGVKALAEQYAEKAKEIRKQLGETETEKNERMGAAESAKRRELRQVRYDKMDAGIQANDRAAYAMDDHTRAMQGILESPQLFTGAGHVTVGMMRQIVQNFMPGADQNTTLPNEALRKVTAQNLQNQLEVLRGDAEEMGGSAGRVMLAQINIMRDAAQNPDSSVPTLRYLTELGARASEQQHKISQLARDYKASHNGELDSGFDQKLADFYKNPKNQLMTPQEQRNINYVAAPRLPTNIKTDEEQKAWARQHGVKPGDPVRINKTYPAQYVPSL